MPLTVFISGAVVTWLLLFPVGALLRRFGIVDRPNSRSSHTVPTVRGAGVAIVAVVAVALAWIAARGEACDSLLVKGYWRRTGVETLSVIGNSGTTSVVLLATFLVLAVVSFIDDLKGLPARLRFGVHAAAGIAAVLAVSTNNEQLITSIPAMVCLAVIAVLWISGYTNAFNFMDGINGIAASQAVVAASGTALIAEHLGVGSNEAPVLLCYVLAGAALGFLPHNFPRARVFMGDVSSAPLGFLLATLAFWIAALTSWWALFWVALLHANFVLDCGITLVRRALRGDRLHEAHREHFYQRLVRAGWSHTSVTLTEAGLQVLVALALWQATNAAWPIKVAVGVAVIAAWLTFFGFAEHAFRKSPAGVTDAEMLAARRGGRRDPDGAVR